MTAIVKRCLHAQHGAATTGDRTIAEIRTELTAKLRCASHFGCLQAVSCSDNAMLVLRRLLGSRDRND